MDGAFAEIQVLLRTFQEVGRHQHEAPVCAGHRRQQTKGGDSVSTLLLDGKILATYPTNRPEKKRMHASRLR